MANMAKNKKINKAQRDIVMLIREKFGSKFQITLEEPFQFDATSYRPDVVVRSSNGKVIKAIIEIEQCSRKHVVGGVITADYCMGLPEYKQKQKSAIYVLSLKEGNTEDYRKRIKMLKQYVRNLKTIVIGNKDEVIDALMRINPLNYIYRRRKRLRK